ncbi:acetyl-CoA carboxylase biotin carboxylase subunit [Ornithinibacillus halophilus]|uniref:biotin carboxylase n=1 Tax=Ornithinibacillus halophilus TaxID=930117 RepID=A0A1M5GL44_9BACI|nr:biotin carboxylase N-terminal domain-containing protein [Ornithinibacillus halophilus]SHG04232.1 acetyl-CoA carboxylase, biotin carboxylase subunit [Ornithinibacillus halophilus]
MFQKVLVANRGAIAARIIRALKTMNIKTVAVYSEADKDLPYIKEADEAYYIGDSVAKKSYLNQEALMEIIKNAEVDGVHPGYGFLSENIEFAAAVEKKGATFIGPSSKWMKTMSHKSHARDLMERHGMPIGKGSGVLGENEEEWKKVAREIGYPVLVKPVGGGGGIGMIPVFHEGELEKSIKQAKSVSSKAFSDDDIYLEKYLENPRHIEFQILADNHGNVVHLYERDCSVQRRHQKVIEESPSVGINESETSELASTITNVIKAIGYNNIGTIEMLRGVDGTYSFLEMNTRLQVEHAVTEEITGVDLVVAQIKLAAGMKLSDVIPSTINKDGHSIEARVYAEDPVKFFPSPGRLQKFVPPSGDSIRIETGYQEGNEISVFYDPLIAKVIVHEENRDRAIQVLLEALNNFKISGIKTNIPFLIHALQSDEFKNGRIDTNLTKELVKTI